MGTVSNLRYLSKSTDILPPLPPNAQPRDFLLYENQPIILDMLPILIFFLTFVFAFIVCFHRCRKPPEPCLQEIYDLSIAATEEIMELSIKILRLTLRYYFIEACLDLDNPRMWGLGPLPEEFTTFHIHEGVTSDLIRRMIELLVWAQRDLDKEGEAINTFRERWVRTYGDMPRDEEWRAVEMMTEWRDGKCGAAAREVVAEAQKYFGMDNGIEAEGFTVEQLLEQRRIGRTGGKVHHSEFFGCEKGGEEKGGARNGEPGQ